MDDLNDPLDDLFDSTAAVTRPAPTLPAGYVPGDELWRDDCLKCGGTGQTRWGVCFRCKGGGKGSRAFKTAPQERAANRAKEAARKTNAYAAWAEANPAEHRWLVTHAERSDFARSLLQRVQSGRELTAGQDAALRRCVAQDAERAATRQEETTRRQVGGIDAARIEEAFAAARANKVRSPKLRLATYIFYPAPETSENAGTIYVRLVEDRVYMGKIAGGVFTPRRECSDQQRAEIAAAIADPEAAAVAYGRRFGACSVCGRELTNGASIDRGIGPICAEKFGW